MAEGDTLVRLARRLRPVMLEREIDSVWTPNPRSSIRTHASRLEGRRVEEIETRGKHLMIHLDEGLSIHSHLGMNGSWRVDNGRGLGKPERNAWLLLDLEGRKVGQFGGATLRVVRKSELLRDPRLARLGPDILDAGFDLETAAMRLRSSPDQVGVALLDQTVVCGIGNIFKSEACFEARVDPWQQSGELEREQAVTLLETARRQMENAVETEKRPGRIYKKTGRPCFRCRAARVRSRAQGDDGRTTYWCPNCQI